MVSIYLLQRQKALLCLVLFSNTMGIFDTLKALHSDLSPNNMRQDFCLNLLYHYKLKIAEDQVLHQNL